MLEILLKSQLELISAEFAYARKSYVNAQIFIEDSSDNSSCSWASYISEIIVSISSDLFPSAAHTLLIKLNWTRVFFPSRTLLVNCSLDPRLNDLQSNS